MVTTIIKFVEFRCKKCNELFYLPIEACSRFLLRARKIQEDLRTGCPYCNANNENQIVLAWPTNSIITMEQI